MTLVNTTVANSPGLDGTAAILNGGGTLTLNYDTLSDNGSDIQTDQSTGGTSVENTILGTGERGACTPAGTPDDLNDQNAGNAITDDIGHNIDQDSSCGLSATGDQSSVDPKLVPIFNNGGVVDTQALLAGSPAIDAGNESDCPPSDATGTTRPQGSACDIGAFEAVQTGLPNTATTQAATSVADTSATLNGTINLDGEAGGFHFVYGTSPGSLTSSSPEAAAGVVSEDTSESEQVTGLSPGTTYYYAVVADNASGSLPDSGSPQSFTTQTDPPSISNVSASATDTTATIIFTLDDGGADTSYDVQYGLDDTYSSGTVPSPPATQNANSGPTQQQITLTGLSPNTTYHFNVHADNGTATDSGDQTVTTAQQITGAVGSPVSLTATGTICCSCPNGAPTIGWGDGSSDSNGNVSCQPGQDDEVDYTVTDTHTYTSANHYTITIDYGEAGTTTQYAQISPAQQPTVTSVSPNSGPTAGGTNVTIDGSNFTDHSTVDFGTNAATNVIVDRPTQITATSPSGHAGTVDVTVTSSSGDTSATGGADKYTYTQSSPPPPNTAAPTVITFKPLAPSKHEAGLTGEVNPEGLPTTAYFVYGLDARYQQFGVTMYNLSTAKQLVGSDSSSHPVSATIPDLLPNALYHVRLVAVNSDGETLGPDQTIKTKSNPEPSKPAIGRNENVKTSSGTVFVLEHGQLVPLTENTQLANGAVIDALKGGISLVAASGIRRKDYTGTFRGGVFKITQTGAGPNKGLTTLTLLDKTPAFVGAPSYATVCSAKVADSGPGAHVAYIRRVYSVSSRVSGRFSTRGRYGAGTVRGTQWTTTDQCNGTLIAVQVHAVEVTDFVKHITILVHAGHHYLALAHPPKQKKHKKK